MKLFDRTKTTASQVDVASFAERLLATKATSSFQPTAALANTTNQSFLSVDAVVLSASEAKLGPNASPALKLQLLVYRVKDDASDPAIDNIGDFLAGTDKVVKPEDMKDDKLAMPRVLRKETRLVPLNFLELSLFHQTGKPQPAAATLPLGTKVRLSGLTASVGKTGEGPIFVNAKSVTAISEVDDAIDGFEAVACALSCRYTQDHAKLAALPLFGGVETLVEKYPFLGTVVEEERSVVQKHIANALASTASRLDGKAAGEGTAYETPVLPEGCDLAALAEKTAKHAEGTSLATLLGNQPVLQLPMLVEGTVPGEKFPRSLSCIMDDAASGATTRLVTHVVAVEVVGFNTKIYLKPTLALLGENARDALSFQQAPITDLPGGALAVRKSQKELGIVFGCPSQKLTKMLSEVLLPVADMAVVAPAHHRDFGDSIFGDGAGGVNWATSLTIDVPSGVKRVGLELSRDFVKEFYGGGSDTITELDVDPSDILPAPTGMNLPCRVIMKSSGFAAINQKSTNLSRLDGPRLPPGKQNVRFFAVFDGCGQIAKGTLEENEAAIKTRFSDGDLMDKLMSNTVLYALSEGKRARGREDSPSTDEPDEDDVVVKTKQAKRE